MAYLVEILFIVSLYQSSIDCYHVECNFYKDTSHLHIVGLRSFEDFKNYGIKCGDYDIVTLVYEDCYLGQITLPLRNIILSYPNLRTLYWRCKGYCVHQDTRITVVGCSSGKS